MSYLPLDKQDINVFHSLDFRSYAIAMDVPVEDRKTKAENLNVWAALVKRGTAFSTIASSNNRRVGFAVWERGPKGEPGHIIRLGVVPGFRRMGTGITIMDWVCGDIREAGKKLVRITLSQNTCLGSEDPDDVSGFMKKCGFKCTDTVTDAFVEYGKNTDGFVFERKL